MRACAECIRQRTVLAEEFRSLRVLRGAGGQVHRQGIRNDYCANADTALWAESESLPGNVRRTCGGAAAAGYPHWSGEEAAWN